MRRIFIKLALVDVNVLVALVTQAHQHQAAAVEWLDNRERGSVVICRLTQLGFLRIICNAAAMGGDTLSPASAWQVWSTMINDDRFLVVSDEPSHLDETLGQLTRHRATAKNLWSDAYLAAYAIRSGMELVTFDRGFASYAKLLCRILS